MHISVIEDAVHLADYIERTAAAYRRSYKLMGRINTGLNITKGILVSSALVAIIPVVPALVGVVALSSVVVELVQSNTAVSRKRERYKLLYVQYKQLLTEVRKRMPDKEDSDDQIIKDIFTKALELQKGENFSPPLERYMREYGLNGYDAVDEVTKFE